MRPASWVRPHTASQRSHAGESAGLRPWAQAIPITSVRSAFEVWLVGRAGRRVGWSRPSVVTSCPLAEPARRAATGLWPDLLG